MAAFLDAWIPSEFPDLNFQCVPHEGKNDLKRSIPIKLRGWKEPGVNFIILMDNDNRDCLLSKNEISRICRESGRSDTIIRLVCQELEAWYLGNPSAISRAYHQPQLLSKMKSTKFKNPDSIEKPSRELARLVPEFQKISGAKAIAASFGHEENRSRSFIVFRRSLESATFDT